MRLLPAQRKSPGPWPGASGFALRFGRMRSVAGEDRSRELVVQAGANDVLLEADIVHDRRGDSVEAAEVDVEIFDLGGPVAQEGIFQAGAESPAELALGGRSGEAEGGHRHAGLTCPQGA